MQLSQNLSTGPKLEPTGSEVALPSAEGNAVSFESVYSAWFHHVRRWGRAFGGLDADLDDLCQEVFIVVRRKLTAFDGDNLAGWLYSITRRTVRDYRRAAWFRRILWRRSSDVTALRQSDTTHPIVGDLREQVERRDAVRCLTRALNQLTEKQRVVFVLFEIEGYSGKEIAELEGVNLATIWSRLHQARASLTGLVSDFGQQELSE